MNLRQRVAAYGARWSQSGRLLLEHLSKFESKDADYFTTTKELVEADDLIFRNWLNDSRVRLDWLLDEPCEGDCGGECDGCQEKVREAGELAYDSSKESE